MFSTLINYLKHIFLFVITITFPFLAVIFLLIRSILHVYLKYKHGAEFFGLMDGYDTVWEIHDTSRGQIAILATFDFDEEKHGDVHASFVRQIHRPDIRAACNKAAMRRRYCLGYNYFIEKDPYEGLVQKMPAYDNEDDVKRILSQSSNEPLGKDDDKMLVFFVGSKAIQFKDSPNKLYPIIMKMHHSLGDGIALMNFCITGLGCHPAAFLKKTDEDFRKMFKIQKSDDSAEEAKISPKTQGSQLGKLIGKIMNSCKIYQLFGKHDENLLHGKPLTGRKHLVWSRGIDATRENVDYVQTVKNIKNRLPGVSFNNVLFAALSASLSDYYQKYDPGNVPEYIVNGIVLLPFIPKFEDLVTIVEDKVKVLDLSNKFVVAFLRIPLLREGSVQDNLLNLVEGVRKEIKSLSESLDIYLTIFFMKYFSYIMPLPLVKFIMSYFDSTICVSNLPGHGRMEMFHGGHIHDFYFWIPNIKKIGLGISMFTYDNRLRVGLIADQAVISESAKAQEIVDNVFKYINLMDLQSQNVVNNNFDNDTIYKNKEKLH